MKACDEYRAAAIDDGPEHGGRDHADADGCICSERPERDAEEPRGGNQRGSEKSPSESLRREIVAFAGSVRARLIAHLRGGHRLDDELISERQNAENEVRCAIGLRRHEMGKDTKRNDPEENCENVADDNESTEAQEGRGRRLKSRSEPFEHPKRIDSHQGLQQTRPSSAAWKNCAPPARYWSAPQAFGDNMGETGTLRAFGCGHPAHRRANPQ